MQQDDAELPADIIEEIIVTKSIESFREKLKIPLLASRPIIQVFIGDSGTGKSTAVNYHFSLLTPHAHTDFPSCIRVIVPSYPTRRKLLIAYFDALKMKPKGKNSYEYMLLIVKALTKYDIKLTILDEGNRLNQECLETIRDIFDLSGRPMVIVGTSKLERLIIKDELIESRVIFEEFDVIEQDEIIDKFLPQLNIPLWTFDPKNVEDRTMGEFLWSKAAPKLRKLLWWIMRASIQTMKDKRDRVTLDDLKATMKNVNLGPKRKSRRWRKKGKFEKRSETRHAGKE